MEECRLCRLVSSFSSPSFLFLPQVCFLAWRCWLCDSTKKKGDLLLLLHLPPPPFSTGIHSDLLPLPFSSSPFSVGWILDKQLAFVGFRRWRRRKRSRGDSVSKSRNTHTQERANERRHAGLRKAPSFTGNKEKEEEEASRIFFTETWPIKRTPLLHDELCSILSGRSTVRRFHFTKINRGTRGQSIGEEGAYSNKVDDAAFNFSSSDVDDEYDFSWLLLPR